MSDDKAKPAKPVLPVFEVDAQNEDFKRFTDLLSHKGVVMYGTRHGAPEGNDRNFFKLYMDHHVLPDKERLVHFDHNPADSWRSLALLHEVGHSLGEGTKFLPKLNPRPEFNEQNKFHKMTADAEARDARISQVAAMVGGKPVDAYDIARASLRVIFAGDMTIVDRRLNTDVDTTSVFRLMQSPSLASDPLMAATKVAILRGDASPLRSKYNVEM